MRSRKFILFACVAGLFGTAAASHAGDTKWFVSPPNANSTVADPYRVQIPDGNGNLQIVNVTNIALGDDGTQKATKIRDAINAAALVGVTATRTANLVKVNRLKVKVLLPDPTKQNPDSASTGSDYRGEMGLSGTATGLKPNGGASQVSLGISGSGPGNGFVATVSPTNLQTAASVMSSLASQLGANGVAVVVVDPTTLRLPNVRADQNVVFGNSDAGLGMAMLVDGDYRPLPIGGPAALIILAACLLGIAGLALLRVQRTA